MSRFELIAVYIMASERNGTLYLGVTGNLIQRAHQHREGLIDGFSKRYGCRLLVWYEEYMEMGAAIVREKDIKKWRRAWKLRLIERSNPQWRDLYEDFTGARRRDGEVGQGEDFRAAGLLNLYCLHNLPSLAEEIQGRMKMQRGR